VFYEFVRSYLGIQGFIPIEVKFGLDLVIKEEDSIGSRS
jgi:hypothetical protein